MNDQWVWDGVDQAGLGAEGIVEMGVQLIKMLYLQGVGGQFDIPGAGLYAHGFLGSLCRQLRAEGIPAVQILNPGAEGRLLRSEENFFRGALGPEQANGQILGGESDSLAKKRPLFVGAGLLEDDELPYLVCEFGASEISGRERVVLPTQGAFEDRHFADFIRQSCEHLGLSLTVPEAELASEPAQALSDIERWAMAQSKSELPSPSNPTRQKGIEEVVSWAFSTLSPEERRAGLPAVLVASNIFPGGELITGQSADAWVQRGLLVSNPGGVAVHARLRPLILGAISQDEVLPAFEHACLSLLQVLPKLGGGALEVWAQHCRRLLSLVSRPGLCTGPGLRLAMAFADCLEGWGQQQECIQLLHVQSQMSEVPAPCRPLFVSLVSRLSVLYADAGVIDEAQYALELAVRYAELHYGPSHPRVEALNSRRVGFLRQMLEQVKTGVTHLA